MPLTVLRAEAPLGEGSLQLFVDADFEQHYFTLYEDEQYHDQLRAMCAFDLLANNTDRKSGHCLLDQDGHIWAIDNGLCFHHEFKLRTVIWEFGGEPVPEPLLTDVARLADQGLTPPLMALLDPFERDALLTRARALTRERLLPHRPLRPPLPLAPGLTQAQRPPASGPAAPRPRGPRPANRASLRLSSARSRARFRRVEPPGVALVRRGAGRGCGRGRGW